MAEQAPSVKPNGKNLGELAGKEPKPHDVKGYIRNMILYDDMEFRDLDDTIDFWFRPTTVREQGSANYQEMEVLGMSHKYRSFSSTNNFKFTFDLYFNSLMRLKQYATEKGERGRAEGDYNDMVLISNDMEQKRRFIESLVIPYQAASGIIVGENPPVILVIPGIVSMRGKVDSFTFEFRDTTLEGRLKEMVCRIEFTEQPLSRVTMRDHLSTGCNRTWS